MKFYFLLLLLPLTCFSQDECKTRISLLTCSPGEELYSTFGHSALRVTDSVSNSDIVYNYGTFNFEEPGFYTKFIRGKLHYYLSMEDFNAFVEMYRADNRTVTEQELNLSCTEKKKIIDFLKINIREENKYYKYDFLFDNCTTRLRDILEKNADTTVVFDSLLQKPTSFRDLIHVYLDNNDKKWDELGIDLLLGAKTDRIMNNRETMFLPDYLLKGFDKGSIGSKMVVKEKSDIITGDISPERSFFFNSPLFIFSLIAFVYILLTFFKNPALQRVLLGLDGFLFFVTGLAGIIMLIMWFGTEHVMCRNNFNILWAWPTHVLAAFFVNNIKGKFLQYFYATALTGTVMLILWMFIPQNLNPAIIPIQLILIVRSASYYFKPSHG